MDMYVAITGDYLLSPLGCGSEENLRAIREGRSGIRGCPGWLPEREGPVMASILDESWREVEAGLGLEKSPAGWTRLEKMIRIAVVKAANGRPLDDRRTLFLLSTTKGNVSLLDRDIYPGDEGADGLYLWQTALKIARWFGNPNEPEVISHACISGVAACILAKRWIESGAFDRVVVIGAEEVSRFIISGFHSFHALSSAPCRPFDAARDGLNLGEAVGTLIMEKTDRPGNDTVTIAGGAITNDANHISGPSRTGEGLYRAVLLALPEEVRSELAFINAHGTATLFNDEMESIAFTRAGLQQIPVFSLKGYLGHTLGASGVVEIILSARILAAGILPVSRGYADSGVSSPLSIVTKPVAFTGRQCLKTASGFGGCNAVIRLKKENKTWER